jgi:hypothetical protein
MPRLAHPLPSDPHPATGPAFDAPLALAREHRARLLAEGDAQRLGGATRRQGAHSGGLRARVGRLLVAFGTWLAPTAEPGESRDPRTA